MADLTVSKTILEQLGGRRFIVMTGAKNFIGDGVSLTFRLPGTPGFVKNGINVIRIELTANDDYTVTFSRLRGADVKIISRHDGIYAENLQSLFSTETGLDTHL